jgi:hypothetical protein
VNDTSGLADLVKGFIATSRVLNEFKNEEVRSSYAYPKEYKGPKSIADQIKALAAILNLDSTSALAFVEKLPSLPDGAEGWFAIPNLAALAKKQFSKVTDPAMQYCRSVQLIHEKIASSRSFDNYREGQITPQQLRMSERTTYALNLIASDQKDGDILIIAAQLGLRHRGRSVRRARVVFTSKEFGLDPLMVGAITLTHPERFVRWEQLHIDCAGAEFAPDGGGQFVRAPFFVFRGDGLRFGAGRVGVANDNYGSASGFLPQ